MLRALLLVITLSFALSAQAQSLPQISDPPFDELFQTFRAEPIDCRQMLQALNLSDMPDDFSDLDDLAVTICGVIPQNYRDLNLLYITVLLQPHGQFLSPWQSQHVGAGVVAHALVWNFRDLLSTVMYIEISPRLSLIMITMR
jgi:hypothetical protein